MAESFIGLPADSTGKKVHTRQRVIGANTIEEQYFIPQDVEVVSYRGRAASFRMPGRAGTAGQRILTLHNATGSAVLVRVDKISVDLVTTVVKAVTVLPPIIRIQRVTALPTNGTALTKVPEDTALTSSTSVTLLNDASADGTSSGSALTATSVGTLAQEFAPRLITAAGYEMFDRTEFFGTSPENIRLRALEGISVFLDYTLATQNPTTDIWSVTIDWKEFTLP